MRVYMCAYTHMRALAYVYVGVTRCIPCTTATTSTRALLA